MSESVYKEEYLPDMLPLYYNRIFPKTHFYKWLCYGDPDKFSRREISFTLFGDVYLRYNTFGSLEEFSEALHKRFPIKIDIGAIYKTDLRKRNIASVLTPVEKEVVFDIDMTDYDDVRTCCSKTDVCKKCWKFMVIACKIIDTTLREDFDFKHILWVFSGRRGVHCWVADETARLLNDNGRSAIAGYFDILKSGSMFKKVRLGGSIHWSLQRALTIIDKYFDGIVEEQDILGTDQRLETFLQLIGSEIGSLIEKDMRACQTSLQRWKTFESTFQNLYLQNQIPKYLKYKVEETKLFYAFPRLDVNVTSGLNHLLKAPFCVHPKTGKISVPFNSKYVDNFDPNSVPTISKVIEEIDAYDAKTKEQEKSLMETNSAAPLVTAKIKDYKKTSLLKYVTFFNEFLKGIQDASAKVKMDY